MHLLQQANKWLNYIDWQLSCALLSIVMIMINDQLSIKILQNIQSPSPYFKKVTGEIKDQSKKTKRQGYFYQLIGLGNINNSLIDNFLIFFNTPYQPLTKQFNQLFRYCVMRFIFYKKVYSAQHLSSHDKLILYKKQIKGKFDISQNSLTQLIQSIENNWKSQVKEQQFILLSRKNKIKKIQTYINFSRQKLLQQSYQLFGLFEKVTKQTKKIFQTHLINYETIEFYGIRERKLRLMKFIESHQQLLQILDLQDESQFYIQMTRYISKPSISLQQLSLSQMYRINDKRYAKQLIRDIFKYLQAYTSFVKDDFQCGRYCRHINQQNIFFSLTTLKPYLNPQNLLEQALGLSKRPMSTQIKLAFFSSAPFSYAYHQSPFEIQNNEIWNDWRYGQTIDDSVEKQKITVYNQRVEKSELQQKSLVWRVLNLFHWIYEKKHFFLYCKDMKQYRKQADRLRELILANPNMLKRFIPWAEISSGFKFNFYFNDLQQLFQTKYSTDDLVVELQIKKLKKELAFRSQLLIELLEKIENKNRFFGQILNCKRYILIYLVSLLEDVYKKRTLLIYKSQIYEVIKGFEDELLNRKKQNPQKNSLANSKNKIDEYMQKSEPNQNKKYLQKKIDKESSKSIIDYLKELQDDYRFCDKIIKQADQQNPTHRRLVFIKYKVKQIENKISIFLSKFTKKQISTTKIDENSKYKQAIFRWAITIIKLFVNLNHQNWVRYEYFINLMIMETQQVDKLPPDFDQMLSLIENMINNQK